ncbi:protein rad9 [Triticum aestivum]|nr:protein rad9-like [Aegilops tauschii subsp. strangulata]XP_044416470.1 protein rad9-like [Triticum aestivum]
MGRQSTRVPTPPPPPPAREPHQVTTTEQAAAVPHFRAASSSTQAPPMDKQAWNAAAAASEFFSPTLHWGVDPRPPGGFVSYLGNPSSYPLPQQPPNQQAMLQHLHYSGGPSHYVPCPAPQPSPSLRKSRTPVTPSGSQQTINVDGEEDGDKRTEKRLAWTSQEDVRLMSAWLRCSTDPINGNNKKSDQYWGDVTNVYNSTTPKNRTRQVKQAKDHWHTLNKLVFQFHCCYVHASIFFYGRLN